MRSNGCWRSSKKKMRNEISKGLMRRPRRKGYPMRRSPCKNPWTRLSFANTSWWRRWRSLKKRWSKSTCVFSFCKDKKLRVHNRCIILYSGYNLSTTMKSPVLWCFVVVFWICSRKVRGIGMVWLGVSVRGIWFLWVNIFPLSSLGIYIYRGSYS